MRFTLILISFSLSWKYGEHLCASLDKIERERKVCKPGANLVGPLPGYRYGARFGSESASETQKRCDSLGFKRF